MNANLVAGDGRKPGKGKTAPLDRQVTEVKEGENLSLEVRLPKHWTASSTEKDVAHCIQIQRGERRHTGKSKPHHGFQQGTFQAVS